MKEKIKEIFKFGIVGMINTLSSTLIYYVLVFCNIHYLLSTTIAYLISTFIGYELNHHFVFKKSRQEKKMMKYYTVYLFSLCLNLCSNYVLVDFLHISKIVTPWITLCITFPCNYLLSKFWVFKNKSVQDITHTFVICAYKDSPYLEECIMSVLNQSVKTNVIMTTSTPSEYIKTLAQKYNIKLYIKKTKSDICADWNFAYNKAQTTLVTIAHQDDIYEKDYAKNIINNYCMYPDTTILYTDYYAYKNGIQESDANSKIKRIIKFPLRSHFLAQFRLIKVFSLSFGNTINCPSVTYVKKNLGKSIFTSNLKFSLDWDTFLSLARKKGRFIYIPKKLVNYRIHENATTKEFILNDKRKEEDIIMFNKIWPQFITSLIMKIYVKSYKTYE